MDTPLCYSNTRNSAWFCAGLSEKLEPLVLALSDSNSAIFAVSQNRYTVKQFAIIKSFDFVSKK